MNLYNLYKTDKTKEREGVPCHVYDSIFHISRAGGLNHKYGEAIALNVNPLRRKIDSKSIDADELEKALIHSFVDGCLVGWNNVRDENDELLDFNRDNAIRLLADLPDLFAELSNFAENRKNYLVDSAEDIGKK